MPKIDPATGYNATFKTFVEFAQKTRADGYGTACAQATFTNKSITVSALSLHGTSALLRKTGEINVNDSTRTVFRAAVADMFGGESRIPEAVKRAMLLDDYDCGKPLTARRIMAVKDAIDADASLREMRVSRFSSPATRQAALDKGYRECELAKLARAVNFYREATGASEEMAFMVVAEPGTPANRLMGYGGRFLENAENFAEGLRLLDLFQHWHEDLSNSAKVINDTGRYRKTRDFSTADTPTKLNAEWSAVEPRCFLQMERFVFEDLACNPGKNLKESTAEAIFGAESNDVTRFVCQEFGKGSWNTLVQMPPEKRGLVFKAFNRLCTLATDAEEAKTGSKDRCFDGAISKLLISRMLRNFEALAGLDAQNNLTAESIVRTCIPEMDDTDQFDTKTIYYTLDAIYDELSEDIIANVSLQMMMEASGCTLDEAREAYGNGQTLPPVPYYSAAQMELKDLGTIEGAKAQLTSDLARPANYAKLGGENAGPAMEYDGIDGFVTEFPDGETFVSNYTQEGRENARRVAEKIETLCGNVHPRQTASVMAALSQSGMSALIQSLAAQGIKASEHSALNFSISKNDATGDIFIRYSSPKALPFAFEWCATVDIDGAVSTTPLKFTSEDALTAKTSEAFEKIKQKLLGYMVIGGERGVSEEDCAAAARKLVDMAKDDLDLLRLLQEFDGDVGRNILAESGLVFRTDEDIARRLGKMREDLAEIRMALKGDERMMKVAIQRLGDLEGESFKRGTIANMIAAARGLDVTPIKECLDSNSPQKLLKTFCLIQEMVYEAIYVGDVLKPSNVNYDENRFAESLALAAIVQRLDEDTIRRLRDAMHGEEGRKTVKVLERVHSNELNIPGYENIDIDVQTFAYRLHGMFPGVAEDVFSRALGIENAVEMAEYEGDMDERELLSAYSIVNRSADSGKTIQTGFSLAKGNARQVIARFGGEAVNKAIFRAISVVKGDVKAVELVASQIAHMLVRPDGTLRTTEEVGDLARAMLANVQEIRTLAKGDEYMIHTGVVSLSMLPGRTMPPGSIRNIFNAVKRISVAELKEIKPGCGAVKIDRAVRALQNAVRSAADSANAGEIQEDAALRANIERFCAYLFLAKCGRQNLEAVFAALHYDGDGIKRSEDIVLSVRRQFAAIIEDNPEAYGPGWD